MAANVEMAIADPLDALGSTVEADDFVPDRQMLDRNLAVSGCDARTRGKAGDQRNQTALRRIAGIKLTVENTKRTTIQTCRATVIGNVEGADKSCWQLDGRRLRARGRQCENTGDGIVAD